MEATGPPWAMWHCNSVAHFAHTMSTHDAGGGAVQVSWNIPLLSATQVQPHSFTPAIGELLGVGEADLDGVGLDVRDGDGVELGDEVGDADGIVPLDGVVDAEGDIVGVLENVGDGDTVGVLEDVRNGEGVGVLEGVAKVLGVTDDVGEKHGDARGVGRTSPHNFGAIHPLQALRLRTKKIFFQ